MITFREATTDEAATVLAIELAAFGEYRDKLDPPSGVFRETVDMVRDKMQEGTFWFALRGGEIVGSVYTAPADGALYLGRLAVLPAYQRQGIGQALISYVEQQARELRLPRVRLGVRIALPHLRTRYERLGYTVIEQHTHEGYSSPTYLIMEKVLTEQSS